MDSNNDTVENSAQNASEMPDSKLVNDNLDEEIIAQSLQVEPDDDVYRASTKEMQEQRNNDTNTKVAKTAVKAAATYFGGPVGNKIADAVNKSGVADKLYQGVGKMATKNPMMKKNQEFFNSLDDMGAIDGMDNALSMMGGGAPKAGKGAGPKKGASGAAASGTTGGAAGAESSGSSPSSGDGQKGLPKPTLDSGEKRSNNKDKEEKKEGKLLNFLKKNPHVILMIVLTIIIFIMFTALMSVFLGAAADDEENSEEQTSYLDSKYDFTKTTVTITNSYTAEEDKVELQQISFADLIKGATYAEFYNEAEGMSEADMEKVFSAYMVVARPLALSIGKYNSETKEIELQSGADGLPYCDLDGCKVIKAGGKNTFVSNNYSGDFTGELVREIDKADRSVKEAIDSAYNNTKFILLMPSSVNEVITTWKYGNPPYNQSIKQGWLKGAEGAKSYKDLITSTQAYSGYKLYDLEEFATRYTYSASNNNAYWWPIGSAAPDSSGLYSGAPVTTYISSPFGYRIHPITGKYKLHAGVDIGAGCNTPIIATKDGQVILTHYDPGGYGNYIDIRHDDGKVSRYAHIVNGGVLVQTGQRVTQGQMIAKVGTTGASTGCHLHFEIRINNSPVQPLDFVSTSNPRPKVVSGYSGVSGNSTMQSVCLSLKNTGFSDNAVAGIMANMHHESGFRLSALGDSGTSYGLCQWHASRTTNLRNYCNDKLDTVDCQLDFLLYELNNSYKDVLNYLQTNNSAYNMTYYFCYNFERPANKQSVCASRASAQAENYLRYAQNNCS